MNNPIETLSVSLFSEILALDQLLRSKISKGLPKGMELSHFSVLNHLAHVGTERTPADLAKSFNLTRGAISNTLAKLEWAGYVHIRPDWDDARRKQVVISPSGRAGARPRLCSNWTDFGRSHWGIWYGRPKKYFACSSKASYKFSQKFLKCIFTGCYVVNVKVFKRN